MATVTTTIAVANQKGGVAKTTTVVSLGAALTELKQRVLLVDVDPQGSLTFSLGIAIVGAVFFHVVGDTFTEAGLRDGFVEASWWAAGGYLLSAAATMLLPDRKAVQRHAREQAELLEAV